MYIPWQIFSEVATSKSVIQSDFGLSGVSFALLSSSFAYLDWSPLSVSPVRLTPRPLSLVCDPMVKPLKMPPSM